MAWFSLRRDAMQAASALRIDDGPPLLAGRYRLGARLGQGASAEVREAVDLRTGNTVAVKLISLQRNLPEAQRKEWLQRLHREAELGR